MIVKIDDEQKTAKVSLRADTLLPILQEPELANPTYVPDTLANSQVSFSLDFFFSIFTEKLNLFGGQSMERIWWKEHPGSLTVACCRILML